MILQTVKFLLQLIRYFLMKKSTGSIFYHKNLITFNRNIYFFLVTRIPPMWRPYTEGNMVEELEIKSSPVNWILREANFTVTISSFVLAF